MRLIERLYQYIAYKGLSFYAFERGCGMANGYLKKQFKGKGTVGSDMLEKLHQKHTDLSLMWLITGKGAMLDEQAVSGQLQGEKDSEYVISKDDIITMLRGQAAMMQRSLVDKEKIILMLEAKLRRMQASQ